MIHIRNKFSFSTKHSQILIIGGGTAGLNVSSQLVRNGVLPQQIRVIEPQVLHSYQPAWTMVGGGLYDLKDTQKPNFKVFMKGVQLIERRATKVDPQNNSVTLEDNEVWTYDQLVVATGNKLDWNLIKGAQESLDDETVPVASIYSGQYAEKMNRIVENFQGGTAIFTEPQLPIKCAGAPQKILYLTHDRLKQKKTQADFEFHKTVGVVFGIPKYSKILEGIIKEKGIELFLKDKLVEIKGKQRIAVFQNQDSKELTERKFDLLHIVPPQSPPSFIKESDLGDASGYVNVHKNTLQHIKYPNVWSIGDSSNLPTSKTAAAVMGATPTLVHNLLASWKKTGELSHTYEGYTSCPIFTSQSKLLLAEFKYDGELDETFGGPLQTYPNRLMFHMKKDFFPFAYWQFMSRGIWRGRDGLKFSKGL